MNLSDNEVMEALPFLAKYCKNEYNDIRVDDVLLGAFDFINRQKALIKRLSSGKCVYLSDDETTEYCVEGPCPNYKTEAQIKAEAIKEFDNKLRD